MGNVSRISGRKIERFSLLTFVLYLCLQPIFMETLIVEFLKVLLDVLERKSHDLVLFKKLIFHLRELKYIKYFKRALK